jgi:hypothetical protein
MALFSSIDRDIDNSDSGSSLFFMTNLSLNIRIGCEPGSWIKLAHPLRTYRPKQNFFQFFSTYEIVSCLKGGFSPRTVQ